MADFDADRNVYACTLDGFSNHSFGPVYSVSDAGSSTENLSTVTIDNLGKMAAAEQEVTGKQKNRLGDPGRLETVVGQRVLRFEQF